MLRFSFPFVLAFSILQMSGQPSNAQVPTAVAPRIMLNPDIVKGARFEVLSTFRPPPQQANLGVVKIAVNLDTVTEGTARRILILLEPGAESAPEPIAWVPLAAWATKLKQ